jgi:uncharacterized protein (TIGR00369 family)
MRVSQQALSSLPFHAATGITLVRLDPTVQMSMPVNDAVRGLGAPLHGGAIATLIDVAAGMAAATKADSYNPLEDGLVTLDMFLQFKGQPRSDVVVVEAVVIQQIAQLMRIECLVSDGGGRVIAQAAVSLLALPGRQKKKGVRITEEVQAAADAWVTSA